MASTVLDKRYILIKSKQYRKVQKKGGGDKSQSIQAVVYNTFEFGAIM